MQRETNRFDTQTARKENGPDKGVFIALAAWCQGASLADVSRSSSPAGLARYSGFAHRRAFSIGFGHIVRKVLSAEPSSLHICTHTHGDASV